MINDLYVLVLNESQPKLMLVCENESFVSETSELYEFVDVPHYQNICDHTELVKYLSNYIKEELCNIEDLDLENCKFHIFTKSDLIELKNGSVFGRNFEVYPIMYNDCNLQGQLLSESDVVQFIVDDPNGKSNIVTFSNQPQNVKQLGEMLANSLYVDNNCNLYMHNVEEDQEYGDPNLYQVKDGQFIIPAEIEER